MAWEIVLSGVCFLFIASISQRFAMTSMTTAKPSTLPGTPARWTTAESDAKIQTTTDRPTIRATSADSLGDSETTITEAPNSGKRTSQFSDSKDLSSDNNTTRDRSTFAMLSERVEVTVENSTRKTVRPSEATSSKEISRSSASSARVETGSIPISSTNTNGLENTTSAISVEIRRTGSTGTDQTSTSLRKDFPSTNAETGKPQIAGNVTDNVISNATKHWEPVGTTLVLPSSRGVHHSEATAAIGTPRSSGATSSIDATPTRPVSDPMSTDTVTRYSDGTILSGRSAPVRGRSSSLHFSENGYRFIKMVLPLFLFTYIY